MTAKSFKAMVVEEVAKKQFERKITDKSVDDLPEGDVLIRVSFSSLNYKDGLSATGNPGVTRKFPHTPGIDAVGVVEESMSEKCAPGDAVIVTSFDLGMNTSGGFGQYIRVPADWVVKLPEDLTPRESMIFGTAGFTAGMSVFELENGGVAPDKGEILVTGATGGVGCLAVAILSKLGYRVAAVSGKPEARDFLTQLGAETVLSREEGTDDSGRPMLKARWAGVVDTVGGPILETAVKCAKQDAVVTCCGLVASPEISLTVFPFILRAVRLIGIDSQNHPAEPRRQIWEKLASEWKPDGLEQTVSEVGLNGLDEKIDLILKGKIRGRVVVNLDT